MRIGMVGLGRMGGKMAERLRKHGHEVIGYSRDPHRTDVPTLKDMVETLPDPTVVWVMVPAGEPTESVVDALAEHMSEGDVIVDGGNSYFRDSIRRKEQLAGRGVGFIDAGVSGGVWGLESGYSLMVGGDESGGWSPDTASWSEAMRVRWTWSARLSRPLLLPTVSRT